ncbi:formyltransferase family protein [Flavobacteriaceae bacterium]|nr:formyltransferase family protein [Flavobacteriaceae bacterium]
MRIIIVTPDEPFYLSKNIEFLLENLKKNNHDVISCILLSPSPYGRRETFFSKAKKVLNIFGLSFFIYYSLKFIKSKLFDTSVKNVLKLNKVSIELLNKSINHNDSLDIIDSYKPDLIISILGNEIFKSKILNLPTHGCINLHSSLLPYYKGVMPSFWVLLKKENYTGVSVFKMDEGIDSGPIISQKRIEITNKTTQKDLISKTKKMGMELIIEAVEKIKSGNIDYINNPTGKGTYFSFPKKSDVKEFLNQGEKFF